MQNSDFLLNPYETGLHVARLDAAATGSVDPVSLWSNTQTVLGPLALSQWLTRANSATLGSTFKITMRGFYKVSAWVRLVAGPSAASISVTLDTPGAPDPTNAQTASFHGATLATEGPLSLVCEGIVCVSQFDAASPGLGIIRIAIDDYAGGFVNPASLDLNGSAMRIMRVADVNTRS